MGHWAGAPRAGHVIAHHTASYHYDLSTNWCPYGYDFFIRYNGQLVVCSSWAYSWNNHATGCACNTIGVAWVGCFGGGWCTQNGLPTTGPNANQKCMMGYVLAHLRTPDYASRLRPHANCYYWNPCAQAPGTTECCGTNYTTCCGTNYNWNASGVTLRDSVRQYRRNWDTYGCCNAPCPL